MVCAIVVFGVVSDGVFDGINGADVWQLVGWILHEKTSV